MIFVATEKKYRRNNKKFPPLLLLLLDPGSIKSGSGIGDKHPESAALPLHIHFCSAVSRPDFPFCCN
jgi:hypothetical protein